MLVADLTVTNPSEEPWRLWLETCPRTNCEDLTSPDFVYDHSELLSRGVRGVSDVYRDVPGGPGWVVTIRSDDRLG